MLVHSLAYFYQTLYEEIINALLARQIDLGQLKNRFFSSGVCNMSSNEAKSTLDGGTLDRFIVA